MAQTDELAIPEEIAYLFEAGEPVVPICDLTVDTTDYTSREFHEQEVAGLWSKVWQMACRANDIPQIGDYLVYDIAGLSIIIVRQAADTIKAFRNTCRHRGCAVTEGCGATKYFSCPFHGWRFGLDGRLVSRPSDREFAHAARDEYGLFPVQAEVFDGWVFVNLDLEAPPLAEYLGETIMRHLRLVNNERMWKVYHFGTVVACNWKATCEAFFEVYHVNATHPTVAHDYGGGEGFTLQVAQFGLHHRIGGLNGLDPVQMQTSEAEAQDGKGWQSRPITDPAKVAAQAGMLQALHLLVPMDDEKFTEWGPEQCSALLDKVRRHWAERGLDLSKVSDLELQGVILYLVFPNFMTFQGSAGHCFYRYRPNGDDHTTSIFEIGYLAPVPAGEDLPRDAPLHMLAPGEKLEDYSAQMLDMGYLIDQDVSNGARIGRGLLARNAPGAPGLRELVLAEQQEPHVAAFHRHIRHWLARTSTPAR